MKKVIAFGASTNSKSINKVFAAYAASLIESAEVEVLDLNEFELPLFSEDREIEIGQPEAAKRFLEKILKADGLVISFAAHNGSYTAAYKNLFDWCSRIEKAVYQEKPAIFLATSPGKGGAKSVLDLALQSAQFFGAEVKGSLSLPDFYDNFDLDAGVMKNAALGEKLSAEMKRIF